MNSIDSLQNLYRQFPGKKESPLHFTRVEQWLRKRMGLTRALFLIPEKGGLKTGVEKSAFLIPAHHPIFRHLEKTGKPWIASPGRRGDWVGFWPVAVDGKWAACFGLGRKRNGKILEDDEKRLMELLADRTSLFLGVRQLCKNLESADRLSSLGFLSAAMVHEIRNPLTAMSTLIQLLPQKEKDQRFMTAFKELMPREINRLIHLTENFLGLAKPSTAAHPVVDLSQVIHRVARLLRPLFEGKKATLTVTAPADLGLKASESQMESLILNLLQNAFQSIQAGGTVSLLARSLKRSSQGPGPWVELQVKDNGEGVFHGDLSLIFDPFFSTKEGGTGLGLAICQKIVQNHQGFLTVKNSPRKGVIFSAVLPLR